MVYSVIGSRQVVRHCHCAEEGGGRGLLKPVATLWANGNSAEVVDLCLQKPCWVSTK